jgi:uncharacterized protein YlbG (UPF0298 family)
MDNKSFMPNRMNKIYQSIDLQNRLVDQLNRIDISKTYDVLKKESKTIKGIDISNVIKTQNKYIEQINRLDKSRTFDALKRTNTIKGIDTSNIVKIQNKYIDQLKRLDKSRTFDVLKRTNTIKGIDTSNIVKIQNKYIDQLKRLDKSRTFDVLKRANTIKGIDTSNIVKIQNKYIDQLKRLDKSRTFDVLKRTNTIKGIDISNIVKTQNNYIKQLKKEDFSKFTYENPIFNISSAIDYAAKEYISDNDIDDSDEKDEILSIADNLLNDNPCVENLSPKQKVFFLNYVFPIILLFIQIIIEFILAKPSVINNNNITNVNNYISTVNNYYIQEGFSKDFLNENNLKIISSEKAIVREKHDCSSKIIGKLELGKVVSVIGKYQKWVKISWANKDEEYYSGWIQNYKLTCFK